MHTIIAAKRMQFFTTHTHSVHAYIIKILSKQNYTMLLNV